ncbi:hypothetical protein ACVWWO_005189 [Bradyrhizobium sp. F1.13.1]
MTKVQHGITHAEVDQLFSGFADAFSHQLGDAGGSLTGPGRARKVVAVSCPERRHEPELPPELSRQARYLVPREFADAGPSQQTMPPDFACILPRGQPTRKQKETPLWFNDGNADVTARPGHHHFAYWAGAAHRIGISGKGRERARGKNSRRSLSIRRHICCVWLGQSVVIGNVSADMKRS